jgi:hypothetical protein
MMEITARNSCPDEETIAAYLEGRLSSEEEEALDAHLAKCELCLEEFVIGSNVLKETAEPAKAPSNVTEGAVKLVPGQSVGSPRLTLGVAVKNLKETIAAYTEKLSAFFGCSFPWRMQQAMTRSLKTPSPSDRDNPKFVFPEIQAKIEIEWKGAEKADIRVTFAEPGKNAIRVTLKKGGRDIASLLLRGGEGFFEDIPYGRHDGIAFSAGGSELGYYTFEIRESRHG